MARSCGASPISRFDSSLYEDGSTNRTCAPRLSINTSPCEPVGLLRSAARTTAGRIRAAIQCRVIRRLYPVDNNRMAFVRVASVSEVQPGWVKEVRVDGQTYAICNSGGEIHALD